MIRVFIADDQLLVRQGIRTLLEAEKDLLKYKRGIEKLLSEKLRKELGLIAGTQAN